MFNIGFFELLIVAAAGLIILGPERFPQAARALARLIYELKRAFFEARSGFDDIKKESQKLLEPGFDDMKREGEKLLSEAGAKEFFSKEGGEPEDSPPESRSSESPPPESPLSEGRLSESGEQNPTQPKSPPDLKGGSPLSGKTGARKEAALGLGGKKASSETSSQAKKDSHVN